MNKVKNWTLIVLTVFVLTLAWQYKAMRDKRDFERSQKEKWQSNWMETMKANANLSMTYREFKSQMSDSLKQVLDELKVKPKEVIRYVEVKVIQKETDTVLVEVEKIAQGTWRIKDSGPCFVWTGVASTFNQDSLNVKRTGFNYDNSIDMVYSKRVKGRILFWRTYEKNRVDVKVKPACGEVFSKTINIEK